MTEHSPSSPVGKPASSSAPSAPSASSDLLASDEDRERVIERVKAAVADGRLPLGELDDRLGQVHGARTLGELAVAARGLPEPGPRDSLVVDAAPTSRFALCRTTSTSTSGGRRVTRPVAHRETPTA
ncbi:DUF1707 SHOCT-like domain-containing protein [Streptomyces sp. NPDC002586]